MLLHGFGQSKASFESASPEGTAGAVYHYNNIYFAQQGYAVVNYSARGFGHSCGKADPATPGCERGWLHLADQRYEIRDTQYLLGLLADQRIAKPSALGVSGISYGGGQTLELLPAQQGAPARRHPRSLEEPGGNAARDRRRLGALGLVGPRARARAQRPGAARRPRELALLPGGRPHPELHRRLYTIRRPHRAARRRPDRRPRRPGRRPPTAATGPGRAGGLRQLQTYHSAAGLLGAKGLGAPAPALLENGWTDDLFPPREALAYYAAVRRRFPGAPIGLQLADLGHSRGSNKVDVDHAFNDQGAAFLAFHLKGTGRRPAAGAVTAYRQTCPKPAPAGAPSPPPATRAWRAARSHPGRRGGA